MKSYYILIYTQIWLLNKLIRFYTLFVLIDPELVLTYRSRDWRNNVIKSLLRRMSRFINLKYKIMRKISFVFLLTILFTTQAFSQSYLGYISKKVAMRDGPGKEYEVLLTLQKNAPVFLYSKETDNDYYHIIDIETNTEGYIPSSYVKNIETLEKTSDKVFSPTGKISSYNPEVRVFNNTSKTMTLKLNSTAYVFDPKETKTINLSPGNYTFTASASGVIPSYGSKLFEKGMGYEWEFYIITKRY